MDGQQEKAHNKYVQNVRMDVIRHRLIVSIKLMNDETYDQLRRAIIGVLGPRPSPERRVQVAADLRAIADQQERMAAREGGAMPTALAPTAPERIPGKYIRIAYDPDPLTGARRVRLSLGKQIWFDLGNPPRIDVQRVGNAIWIVSALTNKVGYQLQMGGSLPSCIVPDSTPVAQLQPGRYAADMRAGAIVVGERVVG